MAIFKHKESITLRIKLQSPMFNRQTWHMPTVDRLLQYATICSGCKPFSSDPTGRGSFSGRVLTLLPSHFAWRGIKTWSWNMPLAPTAMYSWCNLWRTVNQFQCVSSMDFECPKMWRLENVTFRAPNSKNLKIFSFLRRPTHRSPRTVKYSFRTILFDHCVSKMIVRPFFRYSNMK